MDASALESAIKSLEIRSESLDSWLLLWIVFVTVGLIVEVFVVIKEYFHPGKHSIRTLCLELVGPILITIGVAGELGVHIKAGHVNTGLRNANKEVIGLLDKESSAARKETESIRRDTIGFSVQLASAKKDAAAANALAKKYEAGIAEANARAKGAEARAAEAERATKAEEIERLRLQAIVSPRSLNLSQQRSVSAALKRFAGRPIVVSSYGMDGEGATVATQLVAVFTAAGLKVSSNIASTVVSGGFDLGIHVRGPTEQQDLVLEIARLLSQTGNLQVWINTPGLGGSGMRGNVTMGGNAIISGGRGPNVPGGPTPSGTTVSVWVGVKPIPSVIAQ